MNTTIKQTPTTEMFSFDRQGVGAAAIAAKKIVAGETVSFDIWINIKDENNFLNVGREFVKTVFIGLDTLEDEPQGRNIALRISHCNDLQAHQSHSLLASWQGNDINTDPVYISAEIAAYMATVEKGCNYFIN